VVNQLTSPSKFVWFSRIILSFLFLVGIIFIFTSIIYCSKIDAQPSYQDTINCKFGNYITVGELTTRFYTDVETKWEFDDLRSYWILKITNIDKLTDEENKMSLLFEKDSKGYLKVTRLIMNGEELEDMDRDYIVSEIYRKIKGID
jgi:hypothetical protein